MAALVVWLFGLHLLVSGAATPPAKELPSERLVRSYLAAQAAAMQEHAGETEIRRVTAALDDSVVYDHPRAGAHLVGKTVIAQGMRGFLGATRNASITVLHLVASPAVVVVESQVRFERRDSTAWTPSSRDQITVFEVAHGRIHHVVEIWQPR